MRKGIRIGILVCLAFAVAIGAIWGNAIEERHQGQGEGLDSTQINEGLIEATVVRVVDGDTIIVDTKEDTGVRVRLIGIDAPEIGEPGGDEATEYVEALIPAGDTVFLEIGNPEQDRFGRTRAYVWGAWQDTGMASSSMLNARLLQAGQARVMTIEAGTWDDLFKELEAEAKDAGRGIWGQDYE